MNRTQSKCIPIEHNWNQSINWVLLTKSCIYCFLGVKIASSRNMAFDMHALILPGCFLKSFGNLVPIEDFVLACKIMMIITFCPIQLLCRWSGSRTCPGWPHHSLWQSLFEPVSTCKYTKIFEKTKPWCYGNQKTNSG